MSAVETSFRAKMELLNKKRGGKLTIQDAIEAILEGELSDDEVYFFLEDLMKHSKYNRDTDFQFIYYYLGSTDHNRILEFYFTKVVNVDVIYLENTGFVFPDQEEDDYRIHQEMRLLFCAVAGWYSSATLVEKVKIVNYVNLLAGKFNNIFTAKDIIFFKVKKYSEAQ